MELIGLRLQTTRSETGKGTPYIDPDDGPAAQVPTTIQLLLPNATLAGKTLSVYHASDYSAGQWEISNMPGPLLRATGNADVDATAVHGPRQ
jgi:hypothetical protein